MKRQFSKKLIVLDKVVDSGEILARCDVFIGSGGTMTTEAALRGVPTISYDAVPNLDEKFLVRKGLIIRSKSTNQIVIQIQKLLSSDNAQFQRSAKKFLDSMEDPYLKLAETIRTIKKS